MNQELDILVKNYPHLHNCNQLFTYTMKVIQKNEICKKIEGTNTPLCAGITINP